MDIKNTIRGGICFLAGFFSFFKADTFANLLPERLSYWRGYVYFLFIAIVPVIAILVSLMQFSCIGKHKEIILVIAGLLLISFQAPLLNVTSYIIIDRFKLIEENQRIRVGEKTEGKVIGIEHFYTILEHRDEKGRIEKIKVPNSKITSETVTILP